MRHVEITSKVDADGILRLSVPLGAAEANREVKVVVGPAEIPIALSPPDREEWQTFVRCMAGCISDPTFRRQEQGEYEQRSDLFP